MQNFNNYEIAFYGQIFLLKGSSWGYLVAKNRSRMFLESLEQYYA